MKIYGVLFVICMLALIAALVMSIENRKLQEQLEAKRTREGYPWDWTKERERKCQAAMELICDKCHEPYMTWEPDRLAETCALCPVPDAIYKLAAGASPSSPPVLPRAMLGATGELLPLGEGQRAAEGVGPYKSGRKEARG